MAELKASEAAAKRLADDQFREIESLQQEVAGLKDRLGKAGEDAERLRWELQIKYKVTCDSPLALLSVPGFLGLRVDLPSPQGGFLSAQRVPGMYAMKG